jgi:tetratricopeptide (TPR) repeat protein
MTLSAVDLYERARSHLNAGRTAAARRALARASERTDDTELLAKIDGSLAAAIIRQGDPVTAEELCRAALARDGLSSETSGVLLGQLGLLALERGDLAEAITLLDRGIAAVGEDVGLRLRMLNNRSVAHMQAGHLAAAQADLRRAAADYESIGDEVERAMVVHNAGYVSLLEGDLVAALSSMAEARGVLARTSRVNAAICDLDRAEVLRDAGLTREAERTLARVAGVFAAHRMRQARGEAELQLARSLLSHDPAAAARSALSAARVFRAVASDSWAARADGIRVRAELAEGVVDGHGNPAPHPRGSVPAHVVDDAARHLRSVGLDMEAYAVELSAELRRATRGERGMRIRVPAQAPLDVRLLAHRVRSRRAATAHDEAGARAHAAAGADELQRWQESFASLDLQSALAMHGRPLLMEGLSSAMRSARPDVLFQWSERARNFSQRVVPLRPPHDPETASDLAELRQLRSEAPVEWLSTARGSLLQDRVRQRQWSSTAAAELSSVVSMDALQDRLGPDTVVLAFAWSDGRLACVVVDSSSARVVEIADWSTAQRNLSGLRADLDMAAAVRTGPLASVVQKALDERLTAISRSLLGEVLQPTDDRRVVITSPGVLNSVPWSMLQALRGRTFTLAVSASRWVRMRDGVASPAPSVGFATGPRVTRAAEEVTVAASAWRTGVVTRTEAATVGDVTRTAATVDILHIAAHGRHAIDNPMFSGLELADGTLFGYDIDVIPRVPHTVVLSACEVGRSSVRWGEEAIGMTRVWLHAGSRCVVAAPVAVADDDACELLGAMHVGLAAGLAPSEALAAASERTGIVAPFQVHGAGF